MNLHTNLDLTVNNDIEQQMNNKISQKLEIIGFKEAVKKSTSRIQVIFNCH